LAAADRVVDTLLELPEDVFEALARRGSAA
jgi:hypothetical protein